MYKTLVLNVQGICTNCTRLVQAYLLWIYLCVVTDVNKNVKISYTFTIIFLYMSKHMKNKWESCVLGW